MQFSTAKMCIRDRFYNVQTYGTTTDNDNFLTGQIFRIVVDVVDHVQDRGYFSAFLVNVVMQSLDRREQWHGTGCIDDDIRFQCLDQVYGCFGSGKDEQVLEFLRTMDHVVREVRQTFLVRNLGNLSSQTA